MIDKQSMYALCIAVPALMILAFVLAFVLAFNKDAKWQQFQKDHSCKVVGKVSSTVLYANKGSIYVPEKTVYLCDDGIQYEN